MNINRLQSIYLDEEDRYVAKIFFRIILGLIAADIVVISAALFWKDWNTFIVGSIGCLFFIIPLWLLFRGRLRLCGLIFVLITLLTLTIAVTFGQGIHDIGIIAYPMITVVVSLIFNRREYIIISIVTLGALGWLVFGELFGFFVAKPITTPIAADFIVVGVIFLVAVLVVDSLAENMRRNLRLAKQEIAQRKVLEEQLRYLSTHDSLTGIYNRTFFDEELLRMEKSRAFPVSIIVADADELKNINDTRGHAVGDELLCQISLALKEVFRASDILARIGGDEFVILLPQTNSATVEGTLARIRIKLYEHNVNFPDLPLNVSLGASTAVDGNIQEAFVIADKRMYEDKIARKTG